MSEVEDVAAHQGAGDDGPTDDCVLENVPTAENNAGATAGAGDNNALSSKSSDISIEEIGPEDNGGSGTADDSAEVLIPDEEKSFPPPPPPTAESSSAALAPQGIPSLDEILDETDDLELDDDDFEDETLIERLIALSEMFPEGMTTGAVNMAKGSVSGAKWLYGISRNLTWIAFSTASILFLPVMIETQLLEIEEAQKQQQRQILLGPGSAMSAGQNAPLPKAPV